MLRVLKMMPKLRLSPLLMTPLAAMVLAGLPTVSTVAAEGLDENIQATKEDQIRELLSEGVKLYRIGRFDEAALRMKDALLLDPENKLLYEFYLAMGDRLLIEMSERAELEDVLKEILRKARIYQTELRRNPLYIDLLISKLRASERERLAATNELIAIGPIAVPQLVEKLSDNRQEDYRVWSRMVLSRMGYRAVVPLTESLNSSDERQVKSVAAILADIADPRPLPKLQQLIDAEGTSDTLKRVCRNTMASIAARSGMSDIPDGATLYFQEALRYFRDGDQVRDELVANESLTWHWNEEAGEDEFKLQYTISPSYAWNELMAEELLFDGAEHYKVFEGYAPLLAANLAAQDVETHIRLELAKDRTVPARTPDETLEALEERKAALRRIQHDVRMFAVKHLCRGVQQAIVSERYDTGIYIMRLLQDKWTAQADTYLPDKLEGLVAEKAGTVLVAALDHPEKRVRYQAAITLAHLDPKIEFFNAEKVIPLLSDAVGEWGMQAVLVVEPDYRHRNTARHQLMKQGILAFTANDGFQAMQRLKAAPFKDAVVIAGDLTPALRDEHGVLVDVDEQTPAGIIKVIKSTEAWAQIPVFIALPDNAELANEIQTKYESLELEVDGQAVKAVTGFVKRPYNGVEMKGKVEMAIGDAELPETNRRQREDISLRACEALGAVDICKTQYALAESADSLASTIANRADPIRIAALRALGQTRAKEKIDYVTEVYESQLETLAGKPEVRAAFLYCIGLLDPTTEAAQAIILEALTAEEDIVHDAAAQALGHGPELSTEDRFKFLIQQRKNERTAGNGVNAE